MHILYPYNEIIPTNRAHDVFLFQECAALAQENIDVTLLCQYKGKIKTLFSHYNVPYTEQLHVNKRFMIRKNYLSSISWNMPFFFLCQKEIGKKKHDAVLLSVRKQAAYHLQRKVPGIKYFYEVHELCYYPGGEKHKEFELERALLRAADHILVTTQALKKILISHPYNIKTAITAVPLAVRAEPLLTPKESPPLTLSYVGQLYPGQGISLLLQAISLVEGVHLEIIGGTQEQINSLKEEASLLGVAKKTRFLGFVPPRKLEDTLKNTQGAVAPFYPEGKMSFVAHTKLYEYASWQLPFLAPDLGVVREHFANSSLLFTPGDSKSLAVAIEKWKSAKVRHQERLYLKQYQGCFSWQARAKKLISLFADS